MAETVVFESTLGKPPPRWAKRAVRVVRAKLSGVLSRMPR